MCILCVGIKMSFHWQHILLYKFMVAGYNLITERSHLLIFCCDRWRHEQSVEAKEIERKNVLLCACCRLKLLMCQRMGNLSWQTNQTSSLSDVDLSWVSKYFTKWLSHSWSTPERKTWHRYSQNKNFDLRMIFTCYFFFGTLKSGNWLFDRERTC